LRRLALALVLLGAGFAACGSGSGGNSRTIAVDYRSDDFNGAFLAYYPRKVTVRPGMTLKFHQTWTGEPHTVTLGTAVDDTVKPYKYIVDKYYADPQSVENDPIGDLLGAFDQRLPVFLPGFTGAIDQRAAFPCYVDREDQLPKATTRPCPKAQRKAVPFDGRQAYFSSGFIPFEGTQGNTYEMKIAPDAKPGTYLYYCNLHSVFMSGEITISNNAKVESQASINRRGKAEADKLVKPILDVYKKEKAGHGKFTGNLAGSGDQSTEYLHAGVLEFTPRTINTKVNAPVTWTFIGDHTISFNVPSYTPQLTFSKQGLLSFNKRLSLAVKWPGSPKDRLLHYDENAPPPVGVDAGSWDGTGGLHSSGGGWIDGDTYTIRFSKPGSYPYACLVHPGMIGKVVVT